MCWILLVIAKPIQSSDAACVAASAAHGADLQEVCERQMFPLMVFVSVWVIYVSLSLLLNSNLQAKPRLRNIFPGKTEGRCSGFFLYFVVCYAPIWMLHLMEALS